MLEGCNTSRIRLRVPLPPSNAFTEFIQHFVSPDLTSNSGKGCFCPMRGLSLIKGRGEGERGLPMNVECVCVCVCACYDKKYWGGGEVRGNKTRFQRRDCGVSLWHICFTQSGNLRDTCVIAYVESFPLLHVFLVTCNVQYVVQ